MSKSDIDISFAATNIDNLLHTIIIDVQHH